MSSAVLYLAIVALWVGVLVPRWLRRAHPAASEPPASQSDDTGTTADPGSDRPPSWSDEPDTDAETTGPLDPVPAEPQFAAAPTYADADDCDYVDYPAGPAVPAEAWPARYPAGRARVIQARRRLLTMLMTAAIAAVACTAAHLTPSWVCVPVAAMLVLYLLLLRTAAIVDAENRQLRADALQLRAERHRAPAVRPSRPAPQPEPVAEVIDISAKVRDQLYDQYADDTVRAVGD